MTTDTVSEQELRKCLEESIQKVQIAINQIKSKKESRNDTLVTEITSSENIYSFPLNQWEENVMIDFQRDFEKNVIKQITKLENSCRQYFLDVLHQFNYDNEKMEFTEQFNIGMLGIFARELQTRLASIDGYRAAWNGDKQAVDQFLNLYPSVKDKSALWGTTLLYSAARKGHLDLVINLIEHHQCSVNAQNRQHILRALASSGHSSAYYDSNPRAGSTPLHGACYYNHLNVVKYLIDHDADYYIENQAGEIPFMHAKCHPTILEYFRELLIFGYSSQSDHFPEKPIDDNGDMRIIVKRVYSICLMKFLRSGRHLNYSENLAWIRCRGSSFVNFSCYALWQIFLIKHPDALADPIVDMINISTSYDSRFEIHLKTWYFCNTQTNEQLDKGMKYHRRYVNIKIPLISDELLTFNLETFAFTDYKNTIQGHLRWIPKMISNNSKNTNEIIDIDEYATMTNIHPIPLTTSRVNYVSEINEEKVVEPLNDENDNDLIQKIPDTPLKITQSLTGFFSIPSPLSDHSISEDEMMFSRQNSSSIVTLEGFQEHHDQFKAILKRIQILLNTIQSAKDFYQRHLNRKSTLLPALLIAEGYDKVIVTQPRRLPCQLICKRVNETMLLDKGSLPKKLAGWIVSGDKKNSQGKVLYLTDGLLKERLLHDETLITTHTELNKSVVFFIDEVHERSVNIDLCLALLARLLSDKPELQTKVKVIVSSATLDSSVPNLFRRLFPCQITKFEIPLMGTRYPVQLIHRPKKNIIDIVQELCKKRKRHDQILCFVSSVSEVNQCCRLITDVSQGTIVAYPLVQSQHPNVQQANIEHGTLFFSTTVAETSLTFPSLKYVVDTGMINMPVYDIDSKRTILKEVRAAESTLKQRLGRLGRTHPGEYYSLYSFQPSDVSYPVPQIRQSDLMNLEFSLRKSPMKRGLNYLSTYLPDSPSPQSIKTTIKQLQELDIVENTPTNQLTAHGKELAKLPDFSSLAMSKAVLAALKTYDCGHDLICLASCIGVLNTTTMFRSIPLNFKSLNGDFMTLLNLMNRILLVQQSTLVRDANIDDICKVMGLHHIQHFIKRVLKRYSILESFFNSSIDFRWEAQRKSNSWELIAKALLAGYSDNVFISMKDFQERTHHFVRHNNLNDIAVLDLQSTLIRPINEPPVSIVLTRDIRRSTAVRATAILSFIGEIKPEWINYRMKRQFHITANEQLQVNNGNKFLQAIQKFLNRVKMLFQGEDIVLEGLSGDVLNAEFHLPQKMISELRFDLKTLAKPNPHENFLRNLESLTKMIRIFNPLIWRWKAQKQVDITINTITTTTKTLEIIVQGRDSVNQQLKDEFQSFIDWLQYCAVICYPNAGLSPRVLRPQMRYQCMTLKKESCQCYTLLRRALFIENEVTGPFTMDLIEPHIALAYDRIDFDVNNLTVEKDYTHELGMQDFHMKQRIDKMINIRKWTKINEELSIIPKPHWKYHVVLVPLSHTAVLYKEIKHKMSHIPNLTILSIEEIRNPSLEETYEGMKKLIKKECSNRNPNEQKLFHGTKVGFDDRYYAVGMYDRGSYFADNPLKSHGFTSSDPTKRNTRVMFYSKVLIGKPYILKAANKDLMAAPKEFHSVIGQHSPQTEYIVYRYGQALPYLKIIYQGG
ncbi:hypothetical protein I4U23_027314 [Adineta vaga]|nr:hypothetical protein I4U23_027314 [Adineta vaga]